MTEWFVSSAVLAAVLIALRFALRGRISPRLQYGLWALLLLRLLVPVSVGQSAVSVENFVPAAEHRVLYLAQRSAQPSSQAESKEQAAEPSAPAEQAAPESDGSASVTVDLKKIFVQSGSAVRQRYSAGFWAATLYSAAACGEARSSFLRQSTAARLFSSPLLPVRHACLDCFSPRSI